MSTLTKRIIVVVFVFLFLIGIVLYCFLNYLNSPNRYAVSSKELGIIYHCNPYFLEEIKVGESFLKEELQENLSICKHHGYFSGIQNYIQEENQIVVDVSFLKLSSNQLFTLDHQLVGEFDQFHLREALKKGTVHRLLYKKFGNRYELVLIEKLT